MTGEIFRLGDEAIDGPMLLTCSYFHDLKSAKWAWTDPFTQQQHRTLPQCEAMCKSNPPLDASVRTNWTTVFSIYYVSQNVFQYPIIYIEIYRIQLLLIFY